MTDNELAIKESENKSSELAHHVKEFLYNSVSESTRKFYRIDFNIFRAWCESVNAEFMPATHSTVCGFLSVQAMSGIRPSTLVRRLASIKMAHESFNFDNPTKHPTVKAVLKGIKRTYGIDRDKKAPVTVERLKSMIDFCPDTLTGLRDKALLLLGFAGAFRRSELVSLTLKDIERTPEGIKVTIRKSKGDQEGKGQTIAIPNGTRFRVVDTLYNWFNQSCITDGHLFRAINKGGKVNLFPLSTRTVARIVKQYAGKAGLNVDNFSGHSLRSGFITSGANAGADIFKLMEVSRHKNPETVIGYVRESKLFENHAGEKFL